MSPAEFDRLFPFRDEAATNLREMHSGSIVIDRDATLSGMIVGSVRVTARAQVVVSGMVCGDVAIDSGAVARIAGMVAGSVFVDGAALVAGLCKGIDGSDDAILACEGIRRNVHP